MIESYQKLHTGRLLLTTEDAGQAPEPAAVRALLAGIGLVGDPLPEVTGGFASGPRLLELIGFTGCAVQIDSGTGGGSGLVHIRIEGPLPRPALKYGRNSRPPRCPGCRAALAEWRQQVASQTQQEPLLRCAACGATRPATDWDWRRHAGCGRLFVSVEEVFPGEAQPLPGLLDRLVSLGAGPWRHFYVQD